MKKLYASLTVGVMSAMIFSATALAAPDAVLVTETGKIQTYFTDNIGTIITLFVAIAMLLWVLAMAFRSVGIGKPKKVG